jgi:hypothetical protein
VLKRQILASEQSELQLAMSLFKVAHFLEASEGGFIVLLY